MSIRGVVSSVSLAIWKVLTFGQETGHGLVRHSMYESITGHFRGRPLPREGKVLSVSHSTGLAKLVGAGAYEVTEANYPETDIKKLPFADATFDLIVSDQVFEHIEGDPRRAIGECLRVLKPGGRMVHTTCFLIPYHGPGDYWRFSPEGLTSLCSDAAEVELSAGWGHPFIPLLSGMGLGGAPVPLARWHPFHWLATANRPSYAYTVWVVARK